MDLAGFDATQKGEWTPELETLPDDDYVAVIDSSEEKRTKAGTGSYLELRFEVIEGPFNGRKLWSRLNLKNPSDKAVEIAEAELAAICKAVGIETPNVSEDLHDKPLMIKVRSEERADKPGTFSNVIRGYAPKVSVAAAGLQKEKGAAPWEKKPGGWAQKEKTPF